MKKRLFYFALVAAIPFGFALLLAYHGGRALVERVRKGRSQEKK